MTKLHCDRCDNVIEMTLPMEWSSPVTLADGFNCTVTVTIDKHGERPELCRICVSVLARTLSESLVTYQRPTEAQP